MNQTTPPKAGERTQIVLKPGQRITYSGFPGAVIRHYDGNMYEIRLASGVACVDAGDIIPMSALTEEILALLPDKPMSFNELLFGKSKVSIRLKQIMGAYGPMAGDEIRKAASIKYQTNQD